MFNEWFCANHMSPKASLSQQWWAWQGFRGLTYTSPENAGLEHSHQVLLNLLGSQSRRLHGDCMSILYYMCTVSPGIMLQDSFCSGLFSKVKDNEHHRLQAAARSYCITVAPTYPHKTHQQEESVMLLRFPLRTSWLETQLSLSNTNDRWELPEHVLENLRIHQLAKESSRDGIRITHSH